MPATAIREQTNSGAPVMGAVYCPLCTHTVEAKVVHGPKGTKVFPGQRCPRCSSSLDAGYVIRVVRAA